MQVIAYGLMAQFASRYMIFPGIAGMGHAMISGIIEALRSATSSVELMAAQVFRTGIPVCGKRPGPREILHWRREMALLSTEACTDESPESREDRVP